jgi:DNA-binding response OmpR family regulator
MGPCDEFSRGFGDMVAGLSPGRILVVEDDRSLARSIVAGLEDEGFVVEHIDRGDIAAEVLARERFDLIVLDWWLPGDDGLSVLKRHRADGSSTPVLFLTARDAVSDRVAGLDGGADDYLCKPFAFEELLARARVLIRRNAASGTLSLSYRDVRVDLLGHRAVRAGRPLDLTAKELSLLACFIGNAGEILSRSRLYGQVWGEDYDFVTNTLDVHIKELRRKLEMHGPRLIQTVRGRGYVLGDPPAPPDQEGA